MSSPGDERYSLSRSGTGDAAGKLTQRLDVPCTDEMFDAAGAVALMTGYGSKAEWVRAVLAKELFGAVAVMRAKLPDQHR